MHSITAYFQIAQQKLVFRVTLHFCVVNGLCTLVVKASSIQNGFPVQNHKTSNKSLSPNHGFALSRRFVLPLSSALVIKVP